MLSAPLSLRMRDADNPSGHSDVVSPSRSIVTIIILDHRDWPQPSRALPSGSFHSVFLNWDKGHQRPRFCLRVMVDPLLGLLFQSIVIRKTHTAA